MPPVLASFLTLGFIAWLFWRDVRQRPNITRAHWIPVIWMLIISTRFVSEWLAFFGLPLGSSAVEEGSPVDALVYFALIASGLYVLSQRRVQLATIIRYNKWLTLFFVYCFLAIFWSDFPFVSFKRWIKVLGHPIMVLVLLTEPDREEALRRLMKRAAYIVAPISVLFIKYYPEHGRGFDPWSGEATNVGITTNKNLLGLICMILCYFFLWNLITTRKKARSRARRDELLLTVGFLGMTGWLLYMAHSSTSLVALVAGAGVLIALGFKFINKRYLGTYFLVSIVVLVAAQTSLNLSTRVIELLGKNPTLTDRTEVWAEVLKIEINPLLGAGFEGFWLGDRTKQLWEIYWWKPNQAHNGYLETYLNLGLIGLGLILGLLLVTFFKGRAELLWNPDLGRFRIGFLIAVVLYNWTEAAFKAVHPVFFVFYIIAIDYPRTHAARPGSGRRGVSKSAPREPVDTAEANLAGSPPRPLEPGGVPAVDLPARGALPLSLA